MTSKLCKTCGFPEEIHPLRKMVHMNTGKEWKCKKFSPEDVPPKVYIERAAKLDREGIKAVCGTDEEYSDYVKKQKKGCGNTSYGIVECGKVQLCPLCQNQSPSKRKGNNMKKGESSLPSHSKDKPVDTTNRNEAGTQSPQDISRKRSKTSELPLISEPEGTFNLSDKIVLEQANEYLCISVEDVREFIRRLNVVIDELEVRLQDDFLGINNLNLTRGKIDKIVGPKLLEGGK